MFVGGGAFVHLNIQICLLSLRICGKGALSRETGQQVSYGPYDMGCFNGVLSAKVGVYR